MCWCDLRLPYEPDPATMSPGRSGSASGPAEVRHTVIRVITATLTGAAYWRGLTFDFAGSSSMAAISPAPSSPAAAQFHGAEFSGGAVASTALSSPAARSASADAEFSGGTVNFRRR